MSLNGGDQLARGAHSAQFSASGKNIDQLTWDLSMLTKSEFLLKYIGTTEARYEELLSQYNQGNA